MSTTPGPPTPTPSSRAAHSRPGASTSTAAGSGAASGPESLTELEREVLNEYAQLLANLNELSPLLANLSTHPTAQVLDNLRLLERKASLVSTLLKASVYSIVLQQEMLESEGPPAGADDGAAPADLGDGGSWEGSE